MNEEQLARAVSESRGRQCRVGPSRAAFLRWTTPVFRALAWKSFRMIPPLATVMVSAAIGATTSMLLVDSSGHLADVMRADVPAADVQTAYAQPRPLAEAATASVHNAVAPSRRAAPIIVLAASGGSIMGSASRPADTRTGTPSRGSGSADPSGGGDPGAGDGPADEGAPRDGTGSDDRVEGDAKEGGKGNDTRKDMGKGKGQGKDADKDNGKDKVEGDHPGRQTGKEKGEG
jgi:hypothetical protein